MARKRPTDRFVLLIEAATQMFIRTGGFRRTSIDDVAKELGVAKGTIYSYVASKEALFHQCLQRADRSALEEPSFPVPTPKSGATVAYVRERLAEVGPFTALEAAESRGGPATTMEAEVSAIVSEVYAVLYENRTAIKLIGTSALDLPTLADVWFHEARGALNQRLARYLEHRAREGHLRAMPDSLAAARLLTETASWFAVHRHWDLRPDPIADDLARETVLVALVRTLVPGGGA